MLQPPQTDAALLMRRAPRVDFAALCTSLNDRMGLCGTARLAPTVTAKGQSACLASGHMHLRVTQIRKRYARGKMAAALATPIARDKVFDYPKAVAAHRAHIWLSVAGGPGDAPPSLAGARGMPMAEGVPLDVRTALLRCAVMELATPDALAVHWTQSDMVFDPSELCLMADAAFPAAQVIHPLPTKGAGGTGLIAAHSEHFAGHTIQIDPAARSTGASLSMAVATMAEKHAGRLPLAHGDALDAAGGETLYVRHEAPCATWTAGRICLGPVAPDGSAPQMPAPAGQSAAPAPEKETAEDLPAAPPTNAAFADRLARLRAKSAPPEAPAAPQAQGLGEEDLRDLARTAIAKADTDSGNQMVLAKVAIGAICLLFGAVLFGPDLLGSAPALDVPAIPLD